MNRYVSLLVSVLWLGGFVFAQSFEPGQFAFVQQANSALLKKCTWKQRLELRLKGETKKVTLNLVRYDSAGDLQKTLISEQPKEQAQQQPSGGRGSRLKAKIVEKKKEDFKEMMEDLAGLIQSYTQISPEMLKAKATQGEKLPGSEDLQGALGLRMSNLIQGKDVLTLWIDPATLLFRRINIDTVYDKNPVTVIANYTSMPEGPNYMSEAILSYPEKDLSVRIENFDYVLNP